MTWRVQCHTLGIIESSPNKSLNNCTGQGTVERGRRLTCAPLSVQLLLTRQRDCYYRFALGNTMHLKCIFSLISKLRNKFLSSWWVTRTFMLSILPRTMLEWDLQSPVLSSNPKQCLLWTASQYTQFCSPFSGLSKINSHWFLFWVIMF